jgi:hypothetical protein
MGTTFEFERVSQKKLWCGLKKKMAPCERHFLLFIAPAKNDDSSYRS